jgi:tetratricopeptide (TPR) repeat protein
MSHSFSTSFANLSRALVLSATLLVAACGSPADRAQSHYERGMQFLSQQNYVKAGIEFKNAVQLKKDLVGAWRGLLQIEEHDRNVEGMVGILRTIVELDPKDIDGKLKLGRLMLLGPASDQALDLANAALEVDGRNPNALAFRGAVLLKLNDDIGGKRDAQTALEIDPANAEALIVLAAERMMRGDIEGALRILDRQPIVQEKNVAIQLFKLYLFERSGNLKQAEALLRKLTELYPQEPTFRRSLIKLYIDQKRPDDAEKELRARAAENPTNVEARMELVRFLQQVKGPAAARQELVNRISAGGEVFPDQIALAQFDFAQGNIADSIQLLDKLANRADSREHALVAQVKLAEVYLSRKNFDEAEALASKILRQDSRNTDGLRLRAVTALQRGRLDAAIADVREALNHQPRSTQLMLLLADAYERGGSMELAEKQHADATKASGFEPTVSLNYVAFLRRRGSIERAEDVLTELANRWPNNAAVLSTLADVRLLRQNWMGAQEIADRLRRIGNDRGLADQILGLALSGRNRYDDSISLLESAVAAAPGAAQPMAALVGTLVRAQKLDRAVAFLQTVLEANPGNAEAHVLKASVQLLQNAPEQALKSLQAAIERQPKNMVGYRALASFYVREKNFDEAEKVVRAGLREESDNFAMRLALAEVLESKGDYGAAIAEYESMLKEQPSSLIAANNLASLLSDHRGDKASLERAYSIATVLRKSQVPSFKDTLGWIYYQRGDYKNALPLLEEAAAAMPDRAMVRYHLGLCHVAMGELAKASEQLKKARELAPPNGELEAKIKAAQEKAAM